MIANDDLGKLLAPVIQAFGDREDFIVLATTGGKAIEEIPCAISSNAMTFKFLNFSAILPYVDMLVAYLVPLCSCAKVPLRGDLCRCGQG
jgi:hypothetical protein